MGEHYHGSFVHLSSGLSTFGFTCRSNLVLRRLTRVLWCVRSNGCCGTPKALFSLQCGPPLQDLCTMNAPWTAFFLQWFCEARGIVQCLGGASEFRCGHLADKKK